MEPIPQKTILQMRLALDEMDISPAKKTEMSLLLDEIEKKGGMAPKELNTLAKLLEAEEKKVQEEIVLAKSARKETDEFIKKTDQIFTNYSKELNKL